MWLRRFVCAVFTARRYASAVNAMALCVCVCLSVCKRCSTKTDKHRITQATDPGQIGTVRVVYGYS